MHAQGMRRTWLGLVKQRLAACKHGTARQLVQSRGTRGTAAAAPTASKEESQIAPWSIPNAARTRLHQLVATGVVHKRFERTPRGAKMNTPELFKREWRFWAVLPPKHGCRPFRRVCGVHLPRGWWRCAVHHAVSRIGRGSYALTPCGLRTAGEITAGHAIGRLLALCVPRAADRQHSPYFLLVRMSSACCYVPLPGMHRPRRWDECVPAGLARGSRRPCYCSRSS